jgi:hypothetical protein
MSNTPRVRFIYRLASDVSSDTSSVGAAAGASTSAAPSVRPKSVADKCGYTDGPYKGRIDGYVYKSGANGVGYYLDGKAPISHKSCSTTVPSRPKRLRTDDFDAISANLKLIPLWITCVWILTTPSPATRPRRFPASFVHSSRSYRHRLLHFATEERDAQRHLGGLQEQVSSVRRHVRRQQGRTCLSHCLRVEHGVVRCGATRESGRCALRAYKRIAQRAVRPERERERERVKRECEG